MSDEKRDPVEIIEEMIKGRYQLLPASRAAAVAQGIVDRLKSEGFNIKHKDDNQYAWPYGGPFTV